MNPIIEPTLLYKINYSTPSMTTNFAIIDPEEKYVFTCGQVGLHGGLCIRKWDLKTGKLVECYTGADHDKPIHLSLDSSGERLLVLNDSCHINVFPVDDFQSVTSYDSAIENQLDYLNFSPSQALFAPNEQVIVVAGSNTSTILNQHGPQEIANNIYCLYNTGRNCEKHYDYIETASHVNSIDISNNSQYLLTGCKNSSVAVWDLTSATEVDQICCHKLPVLAVKFSPNMDFCVSGGYDGINIYRVISHMVLRFERHIQCPTTFLDISKDSRYILTSFQGVSVIDLMSDESINISHHWSPDLASLKFCPKSYHIFCGYRDYAEVWSI